MQIGYIVYINVRKKYKLPLIMKTSTIVGTVVKRIKFYNELIANVI